MKKMLMGIVIAGSALLSQPSYADDGSNDNLNVKIQTVDGKDTTIRALFEANPKLEFMLVDAGNWACPHCRTFADKLASHTGWKSMFSGEKCSTIAVVQDNVKAWAAKYGNEHSYKGSIAGIKQALAPNASLSAYPFILFIDRSGALLGAVERTPNQAFVDVIQQSCGAEEPNLI